MAIQIAKITPKALKVSIPKKVKAEKPEKKITPILYAVVIFRHKGYSRILVNRHEDKRDLYVIICKSEKEEKQLESLHKTYKRKHCSRYIERDLVFEIPVRKSESLDVKLATKELSLGSKIVGNTKDKKQEVLQLFFKDLDFKFPNIPYEIRRNSEEVTTIYLLPDVRIGRGEHLILLDFTNNLYTYKYNGKVITSTSDIKKIV